MPILQNCLPKVVSHRSKKAFGTADLVRDALCSLHQKKKKIEPVDNIIVSVHVHVIEPFNNIIVSVHVIEPFNNIIVSVHVIEPFNNIIVSVHVHVIEPFNNIIVSVHVIEPFNNIIVSVHVIEPFNNIIALNLADTIALSTRNVRILCYKIEDVSYLLFF